MADKIMVCEECDKVFKIRYDLTEEDEIRCPSCDSIHVQSIYRQENVKTR